MHVGRYLNGYEYSDGVPPGWSDWHGRPALARVQLRELARQRERLAGVLPRRRPPGRVRDRLLRPPRQRADRAGRARRPPLLPAALVRRPAPRLARATPTTRPPSARRRLRRATAICSRPLRSRARPASTRRRCATSHRWWRTGRAWTPTRVAAIEENWRQELESLQAVDEAVARVVDTLARTGELGNTLIVFTSDNGFMHGEHRAKAEKVLLYEESVRVPLVMRGPGIPRNWRDPRPVAEHRRRAHDRRRRRRDGRPQARRPLAVLAARRPHRLVGPRPAAGERQRRERRTALPRDPHEPLRVRRAPDDGRVRAVRPRARPVRAAQPGREPGLRGDPARPRPAPAHAEALRRARLRAGGPA